MVMVIRDNHSQNSSSGSINVDGAVAEYYIMKLHNFLNLTQ
jgi:hypothetical protein